MKITFQIKAKHLPNVAGVGKGISDPYAVVSLIHTGQGRSSTKPTIFGKTEIVKNSLNPCWVTPFALDYDLGSPTKILIKIFDEVRKGENIPMGSALFDISEVLGTRGKAKAKKMRNNGLLNLRILPRNEGDGKLRLKMSGNELTNKEGAFRKSDPFYEIFKKYQGNLGLEWSVVHRSPVTKNDLNPNWPEEVMDLNMLCDGDLDQAFLLKVFDYESSGQHVLIGEVETSVNTLVTASNERRPLQLMEEDKETGTLVIGMAQVVGLTAPRLDSPLQSEEELEPQVTAPPQVTTPPVTMERKPTFESYIYGGCELSLSVAIDFTASNGHPLDAGTLHYLSPDGVRNDYETAMRDIGGILAKFDSDEKIPVFGFGANKDGIVQQCFQCGPLKEVHGVEGLIDAYHQTLKSEDLIMSGPTDITEILQVAAACAISDQDEAAADGKQKYSVLLILTDGTVSDMSATLQAVESIHHTPLSVVIVGIGEADFSAMHTLDDNTPGPDVVQFVEFNAHKSSSTSLTNATLDEIPAQLVDYFARNNIAPNPPIYTPDEDIDIENCKTEEEEIDLMIGV